MYGLTEEEIDLNTARYDFISTFGKWGICYEFLTLLLPCPGMVFNLQETLGIVLARFLEIQKSTKLIILSASKIFHIHVIALPQDMEVSSLFLMKAPLL